MRIGPLFISKCYITIRLDILIQDDYTQNIILNNFSTHKNTKIKYVLRIILALMRYEKEKHAPGNYKSKYKYISELNQLDPIFLCFLC